MRFIKALLIVCLTMENEPWFREFDGWWYVYVRKKWQAATNQARPGQGK
jgi:hypothetical protein